MPPAGMLADIGWKLVAVIGEGVHRHLIANELNAKSLCNSTPRECRRESIRCRLRERLATVDEFGPWPV